LSSRQAGATLGGVVATVTVVVIVARVLEAAAPVPTPISILNLTAVPITVQELQVAGISVLSGSSRRPLGASSPTIDYTPDATVNLSVGRPLEVRARIIGSETFAASCTPEPRPYGACLLRVGFRGTAELQCEYACESKRTE
jgi:hypothetical protein